jgi:hypothetical protein
MSTQQQPDDPSFSAYRTVSRTIGTEHSFVVQDQVWTVSEFGDPISSQRVLIFEGPGIGRKVREYPANWRQLSDDELYALSWSK